MVEYLKDLQIRNIHTKPELGLNGVFMIGDRVFILLRKLVNEGKIRGAYFSHYYEPPKTEAHAKVGIRYHNLAQLDSVSSMLDALCHEYQDVVIDRGKFEPTTGECKDPPLPADIVVDYIICHSFEFLLKVKNEFGDELPPPDRMGQFLAVHRQEVTHHIVNAKDIFRDEQNTRPLTPEETSRVWERFVHHLLNASKSTYNPVNPTESYEPKVKRMLLEHGIDIA